MENNEQSAKLTFPSAPDAEGLFFASEEEYGAGIQTKEHENGSTVKTGHLADKRKFTVRRLKGRDFVEAKKRIQSDNTQDMETLGISLATKIDGQSQPPEFYLDDLYQEDYLKIYIAYGSLNF